MAIAVVLEEVTHEYERTEESDSVRALDRVSLSIGAGEFAVLMGPSGSGKSTLLNLIGAVDQPTAGRIHLGDAEISRLDQQQLTLIRRDRVGFVFQFFNLLPTLTVRENVGFPLALQNVERREAARRVEAALEQVGLSARATHYPNQLSGGEMQRVAIARATVHRPGLLIADEPTGNLDSRTGERILELIREIHRTHETTIVMATHSDHAASFGDYVVTVIDGEARRRGR